MKLFSGMYRSVPFRSGPIFIPFRKNPVRSGHIFIQFQKVRSVPVQNLFRSVPFQSAGKLVPKTLVSDTSLQIMLKVRGVFARPQLLQRAPSPIPFQCWERVRPGGTR